MKRSDHCLIHVVEDEYSLLSGSWVPLACLLLQVCARGDARIKRGVAFCLINLVSDMLLGAINERWPFTEEKKKNIFFLVFFFFFFCLFVFKQTPSVHGILQATILEWVAIPSFRGSFQPRNWTSASCTAGRFFTIWATRQAQANFYWSIIALQCC